MNIIHPSSLVATLNSAADALFYQKSIPTSLRKNYASLLVSHQVQSGSHSGFFLLLEDETTSESRLFTGERIYSKFARQHIQLIEATRLLNLLAMDNSTVAKSVQIADERMNAMCYSKFCIKGECKAITIVYMRYLASSSQDNSVRRINSLLRQLAGHRDGKGKWKGFPYFYTLLMLSEVNDPLATHELQYATPAFPKQPVSTASSDDFSRRRQEILNLVLSRS
jgi:hypothetical protein